MLMQSGNIFAYFPATEEPIALPLFLFLKNENKLINKHFKNIYIKKRTII
jgi:hypothetical protein